ncbi:MAG TPA: TIM-barrel domain-containing protein [Terriglobales bacterium]|nr:TIM-barrel domain-containing protein [Terriglobales bacterium]
MAQQITTSGRPAQLDVRAAGEASIRVTLKPVDLREIPANPAVVDREYPSPAMSLRQITAPLKRKVGTLNVEVRPNPLTLVVTSAKGELVQEIVFENDGNLTFKTGNSPILGMGEGGPRPERGKSWREQKVQFDRRGLLDMMEPRWQSDMYGSRNPVAMLLGTEGWGIFVAAPWVHVDLRNAERGVFMPFKPTGKEAAPQNAENQQQNAGKGLPPIDKIVPGLYDFFIFDAHDPAKALKDYSMITGPAVMPPKWALGFMQSHRTLEDEKQMLGIVDTFRSKNIPIDAVIYLGSGFCPRGWNKPQPSFEFNPEVFQRDPKLVLADMHERNVKVIVHTVPWDRDKLPTLHGTIPAKPDEKLDSSHIQNYWTQHVSLIKAGIDGFWPDEGDWFNLHERIKRHQMYYQGSLWTTPNVRPWSLQRNGYPGIAQWGGWVWSGDTESSWKTLEAQIAVGLNYSLSIGPYWGSDIGGFYPNRELTGELFARWFQLGAFNGSFRSHGRTWWTRLPWGWGLSDMGPREHGNTNAPLPEDSPRQIPQSEMNNPAIEPVARKYAELRYQLMPYTYTLAWEARNNGLPLQRALWLHYPDDERARGVGDEFLWGRDLLIAPVYKKGVTSREVYLPKGEWYDWWTNTKTTGGRTVSRDVDLATMPIYVRAGAIIPFDPVRQYTAQEVDEPTTLRVYRGSNGEFTLYDDDGVSQEYLTGKGTWTRITWNDAQRQLTLEPGAPAGMTNVTAKRTFRVQVLPDGKTTTVNYTGKRVRVNL